VVYESLCIKTYRLKFKHEKRKQYNRYITQPAVFDSLVEDRVIAHAGIYVNYIMRLCTRVTQQKYILFFNSSPSKIQNKLV